MTDSGERLAAYLAGDLDPAERAEVESALSTDGALRERLERLRRADEALARLPAVEMPEATRQRLRAALDAELRPVVQLDAVRRRHRPWRTFAAAGAAAAVVLLIGVGAGTLLRGGMGGEDTATTAAAPEAGVARLAALPIPVAETDNDYDDLELEKLAFGLDTASVVPPTVTDREAAELSHSVTAALGAGTTADTSESFSSAEAQGDGGTLADEDAVPEASAPAPAALEEAVGAAADDVQRCLPEIVSSATTPVVPAYIEVARYRGEPAIIYAFAANDPATGRYRRVEVWAVARAPAEDCRVLAFAQQDRP